MPEELVLDFALNNQPNGTMPEELVLDFALNNQPNGTMPEELKLNQRVWLEAVAVLQHSAASFIGNDRLPDCN